MQTMQILQEIKLKYGLNTTQVAKQLGMKQSTVHRIATGETKDCRLSNHSKILSLYESLQSSDQTKTPIDN